MANPSKFSSLKAFAISMFSIGKGIFPNLKPGRWVWEWSYMLAKKNADIFPVEISLGHYELDGEKLAVAFVTDVTDQVKAKKLVAEREAWFRNMADNSPVMIWVSGSDKLCTYFNNTWLEFTGRTMEQELGNGWAEGVHPEDLERCLAVYNEAFDLRQSFIMEYRLRRRDGQYRWLQDVGKPTYSSDNVFTGYIGSCSDIHGSGRGM